MPGASFVGVVDSPPYFALVVGHTVSCTQQLSVEEVGSASQEWVHGVGEQGGEEEEMHLMEDSRSAASWKHCG